MEMRGERQGRWHTPAHVALAHAGLPDKAAGTSDDKAASGLARLPGRDLSLSLVGGGGGRWLALAGRRLATRCVLVPELAGWGGWRLGG